MNRNNYFSIAKCKKKREMKLFEEKSPEIFGGLK